MSEFAWPAVVLIIAFVFIFTFREELSGVIKHAKKLGAGGIETHEPQVEQQQQVVQLQENQKAVEKALQIFDNPLVLEAEELIRRDLEGYQLNTSESRGKALIRALASTNIKMHFEQTFSVIWASQMTLLHHLNSAANGTTEAEVQSFYESAKAAFPAYYTTYTFAQWIVFLGESKFVENRNDRVFISVAGREFLKYLVSVGRLGPYYG